MKLIGTIIAAGLLFTSTADAHDTRLKVQTGGTIDIDLGAKPIARTCDKYPVSYEVIRGSDYGSHEITQEMKAITSARWMWEQRCITTGKSINVNVLKFTAGQKTGFTQISVRGRYKNGDMTKKSYRIHILDKVE